MKLVSVNIERSKHLQTVLPFLERERPDVLCLQEVMAYDAERFTSLMGGAEPLYAPMAIHSEDGRPDKTGPMLLSRTRVSRSYVRYYRGSLEQVGHIRTSENGDPISPEEDMNCALLFLETDIGGERFAVANTHFTWSAKGAATEAQRTDMRSLITLLGEEKEFVLCGDFNAPRGGEVFGTLAAQYKDNIPPQYQTSIDVNLHRAGRRAPHELADKMVDGLFSTGGFECTNVRLVEGVSDHMAVVAEVSKKAAS